MLEILSNIDPINADNLGGGNEFLFTTPNKVANKPQVFAGNATDNLTLVGGALLNRAKFTQRTLTFVAPNQVVGAPQEAIIKAFVAKDRPEILRLFMYLKKHGLVCMYRDFNGYMHLLGNKDNPGEVVFVRDHKQIGGRNGTDIEIRFTGKNVAAFYQADIPALGSLPLATIQYNGEFVGSIAPGDTFNFEINKELNLNIPAYNLSETATTGVLAPIKFTKETRIDTASWGNDITNVQYSLVEGGPYTNYTGNTPFTIPAGSELHHQVNYANPGSKDFILLTGEKLS